MLPNFLDEYLFKYSLESYIYFIIFNQSELLSKINIISLNGTYIVAKHMSTLTLQSFVC